MATETSGAMAVTMGDTATATTRAMVVMATALTRAMGAMATATTRVMAVATGMAATEAMEINMVVVVETMAADMATAKAMAGMGTA